MSEADNEDIMNLIKVMLMQSDSEIYPKEISIRLYLLTMIKTCLIRSSKEKISSLSEEESQCRQDALKLLAEMIDDAIKDNEE